MLHFAAARALAVPLAVAALAGLAFAPPASAADPISDAEALALEISGELVAPPAMVVTIDTHLDAIRAVEPVLEVVHPHLDYEPGILQIGLTSTAWDEHVAGTYTGLDALNAMYGPVDIVAEYEFIRMIVLDFEAHYNATLLAPIYDAADGVLYADDSFTGFSETDITPAALGDYTFRYGWFDCPLGCVYNHYWAVHIDGTGAPVLDDEWGDPLVGLDAPEPTAAAFRIGPARPNPFAAATSFTVSTPAARDAAIEVVDVSGRHVRTLHRGAWTVGTRAVTWDGRDDAGARLGSGVYFVAVQSGDAVQAIRKVTLLR